MTEEKCCDSQGASSRGESRKPRKMRLSNRMMGTVALCEECRLRYLARQ